MKFNRDDPWLLHFTHIDNLPAIIASGSLHSDAVTRAVGPVTEVGDPYIKAERRNRAVPVPPGGVVGDYVPFYFAPRSPMMFRIASDCRDGVAGRYSGGDRPLVYLWTRVSTLVTAGVRCLVTDGNAAAAATTFRADPGEAATLVDWPLMREKHWRDTEADPDRRRRRAAELLAHGSVPLSAIEGCAVYSDKHVEAVRMTGSSTSFTQCVLVRPSWYYGYEPKR